jgi:hypothetical protein
MRRRLLDDAILSQALSGFQARMGEYEPWVLAAIDGHFLRDCGSLLVGSRRIHKQTHLESVSPHLLPRLFRNGNFGVGIACRLC